MEQAVVLGHIPNLACRYCGSSHTVRYGSTWRKKQRYLCHGCEKTFVDNGAAPGMKSPVCVIASALAWFYQDAAPLHAIQRSLLKEYGVQSDHSNIRRWIIRYTRQAVMALAGVRPHVGQEWVVHETCFFTPMSRSRTAWLWDVIDIQTGFLLASGFSTAKREALDFEALFDLAVRRAGTKPEVLFADMVLPPQEGLKIRVPTTSARKTLKLLKDRTLILQRLIDKRTAHLAVSGWAVHYNFFRQSPELKGRTPASAAGLDSPFKNWTDVVAM